MGDFTSLQNLARKNGISPGFRDNWNNYHEASERELESLLIAMGVSPDTDLQATLPGHHRDDVLMSTQGHELEFSRPAAASLAAVEWQCTQVGDGLAAPGVVDKGLVETAHFTDEEGQHWIRYRCCGSAGLESGYYTLSCFEDAACADQSLIVIPERAYEPESGKRLSGVSVQLYALQSERNWGIGDFTDLASLCSLLADFGIDAVGLNPLHALYLHHPERCSPYSPSSRMFFNPLYLDVEAVPGYAVCQQITRLLQTESMNLSLQKLKSAETVDYIMVQKCKLEVLRILHEQFVASGYSVSGLPGMASSALEFTAYADLNYQDFVENCGETLQLQSRFEAFDLHFSEQHGLLTWREWPAEYLDPHSVAAEQLAVKLKEEVDFSQYLQWLCAVQIGSVADHCRACGMQTGLYFDLAVGVDVNGAEPWTHSSAFAHGAHIGAPPDSLGPMGQDWSLVPYRPKALYENRFAPYIAMLQANMQFAGALRIDHVMGLMRQYWCLPKLSRETGFACGTYIDFPFNELLGIALLESHRNRCLLIGEDLGTVPDTLRDRLDAGAVHRYRVLYFEKDGATGLFDLPEQYPLQSLATASTHDLPTLAGFWNDDDLHTRGDLGLFPSAQYKEEQWRNRMHDKSNLLGLLRHLNLLPEAASQSETTATKDFVDAIHILMAGSASRLMMMQLEDLLLQRQMVNMPGTVDEHPNWRCRLALPVEQLRAWLADNTAIARVTASRRSMTC